MNNTLKRIAIFGIPVLLGIVNSMHPLIKPPIYEKILPHLDWWLHLHYLNLGFFSLLGLSAWLLIRDLHNPAATIARIALAVYVPLYAAFDALAGISTGLLTRITQQLPQNAAATGSGIIDAFYGSPTVTTLAIAGSIAWIIAMLASAVAFAVPERRRWVLLLMIILFAVNGWARGNIFQAADGISIRPEWWLVTLTSGIAVFFVAKPRVLCTFLVLAGMLYGAQHPTPTGPLGMLCFIVAAAVAEFGKRKDLARPNAG
jgi:hypothetical protein